MRKNNNKNKTEKKQKQENTMKKSKSKKTETKEKTILKKQNSKETLKEKKERTKKLAIKSGIGFSVMQNFSSNFFDAFAIALGFSAQTVSLITSLPLFLNSILQLFTYKIIKFLGRHKALYYSALIQAFLIGLILIAGFYTRSAIILILLFTLFFFVSNIIAVSWISIIGDVLRKDERGKYIAYRNKIINIVSLISLLIAGTILNYLQKILHEKSFIIIFTIAIIARIYTYFTLKQYYVPKTKPLEKEEEFTLIQFITRIKKSNFVKYTLIYSFLIFLMYLFATTISFYRLKILNLDYLQFTLFKILFILGMILSYSYWGKISDKYGNKLILIISTFFKSIIIISWALITNIYILYFIEFLSGIFHSAFMLGGMNYFLDAVSPKKRIIVRPYFNFFVGISILLSGLTSSNFIKYYDIIEQKLTFLPQYLQFNNPFQTLFLISGTLRFIVVLLLVFLIKELRKEKELQKLENKIKKEGKKIIKETKKLEEKTIKKIKKAEEKAKRKVKNIKKELEEKIKEIEKPIILAEHNFTRTHYGFINYTNKNNKIQNEQNKNTKIKNSKNNKKRKTKKNKKVKRQKNNIKLI